MAKVDIIKHPITHKEPVFGKKAKESLLPTHPESNIRSVQGITDISKLIPQKNTIVVAPSGGHFNDIQKAIDSIVDQAANNIWTILIYPGTYEIWRQYKKGVTAHGTEWFETVPIIMKSYVNLVGISRELSIIDGIDPINPNDFGAPIALANHCRIENLKATGGGGSDGAGISMSDAGIDDARIVNCDLSQGGIYLFKGSAIIRQCRIGGGYIGTKNQIVGCEFNVNIAVFGDECVFKTSVFEGVDLQGDNCSFYNCDLKNLYQGYGGSPVSVYLFLSSIESIDTSNITPSGVYYDKTEKKIYSKDVVIIEE